MHQYRKWHRVQGAERAFPAQRKGCRRTWKMSVLKLLYQVGVAQPELEEKEAHRGLSLSVVVQGSYEDQNTQLQLSS